MPVLRNGIGRVIDALRYLLRKGRGSDDVRRELDYFRSNRGRTDYAAAVGLPIGSGAVEAASKTLVTARMKRSGQRWDATADRAVRRQHGR